METTFFDEVFPTEIMEYFEARQHPQPCSVADRCEYRPMYLDERNQAPNGYPEAEHESKGFTPARIVQDFPIRGKGAYLRVRKRRWRHKQTGDAIQRDFSFMAEGSKFTRGLSGSLKDASGYATRYHAKHSHQNSQGRRQEIPARSPRQWGHAQGAFGQEQIPALQV